MRATLFLATLLPVAGVLASDVTPYLSPHGNLLPVYDLVSPLRYRGLSGRQSTSCRSGEKVCGDVCIQTTDTCCPDRKAGCITATEYCDLTAGGSYLCCPLGEQCSGATTGCRDGEKLCGTVCIENEDTCCPDQQGGCTPSEYCVQPTPNGIYGCCDKGKTCVGTSGGGTGGGSSSVVSSSAPSPSTTAAPATSSASSSSSRSTPPVSSATPDDGPDQTDAPDIPTPTSTSSTSQTPITGATVTPGTAGGAGGFSSPSSTPVRANLGVRSSAPSILWAASIVMVGMVLL